MVRVSRLPAVRLFLERWDIMKVNRLQFGILLLPFVLAMLELGLISLVSGAPVTLPSGVILDLTQEQVEAIKGQPGVFFGAESAHMLPLAMWLWLCQMILAAAISTAGRSTSQRVLTLRVRPKATQRRNIYLSKNAPVYGCGNLARIGSACPTCNPSLCLPFSLPS